MITLPSVLGYSESNLGPKVFQRFNTTTTTATTTTTTTTTHSQHPLLPLTTTLTPKLTFYEDVLKLDTPKLAQLVLSLPALLGECWDNGLVIGHYKHSNTPTLLYSDTRTLGHSDVRSL